MLQDHEGYNVRFIADAVAVRPMVHKQECELEESPWCWTDQVYEESAHTGQLESS